MRSCGDIPSLFKNVFGDSAVAKKFTLCRRKAPYVASAGLALLLAKKICSEVAESSVFTMFDEATTTTVQNNKQMDILLRY